MHFIIALDFETITTSLQQHMVFMSKTILIKPTKCIVTDDLQHQNCLICISDAVMVITFNFASFMNYKSIFIVCRYLLM